MIRCVAIDDEPLALTIIEQYCKRRGGVSLTTYTSPVEGFDAVCATPPDLLLLDIEMGGVNGLDLARRLPEGVSLVFTTAYAQFAIDGFDLDAVDYLHKPFSFSRFERALTKVESKLANTKRDDDGGEIYIKVDYQGVKLSLSSISYVEAMDNYVKIHIASQRPIIPQMSMKSVEELLPTDRFIRIHKSYIVPRHSILTYRRGQVTLSHDDVVLPVGRTYQAEFSEWMEQR